MDIAPWLLGGVCETCNLTLRLKRRARGQLKFQIAKSEQHQPGRPALLMLPSPCQRVQRAESSGLAQVLVLILVHVVCGKDVL